ncbi:hypothetical protein AFGD_008250 [Aspergillus flavus]|nr:hypothetical protein AFGD_008250 [Aspergillus flavus]
MEKGDQSTLAYRDPKLPNVAEDLVVSNVLGLDCDERLWAEEGGYAHEPTGDIHTLEVPDGVKEMVTLFHVTGACIYVDPDGVALGIVDVFSKLQAARKHYEEVGLGADFADQFVR